MALKKCHVASDGAARIILLNDSTFCSTPALPRHPEKHGLTTKIDVEVHKHRSFRAFEWNIT